MMDILSQDSSGRARTILRAPEGFSLVEILVAMALFLIISAGVTSMMMAGVRSTVSSRLETMGKEAAQQEMENIMARPFYVPYSYDPDVGTIKDADILDRYYPNTNTTHVTDPWGWEGWYTETSDDAYYTVVSPEDSNTIVLTVEVRFVDYAGNTIIPQSDYNADSVGYDNPASDLLSITVTATWLSRGVEESWPVFSQKSRADQETQGGSGSGGGDSGCSYSSQNSIDVTAGTLSIYTGTQDPYTNLVDGVLGEAIDTASYDCVSSLAAHSTGGRMTVSGGDTSTAGSVSVLGPPDDSDSSGPTTVGPTSSWPKLYLGSGRAAGSVDSSSVEGLLSSASGAELAGVNVQLQQVSGSLSGNVNNYKRWDFLNPVMTGQNTGAKLTEASIDQDNGVSTATGRVAFSQVNLLPLQAYTASTPSALQGLVIVRNFQATAVSEASEEDGSASNSVTYSATIGMFNLSKAASCAGDACYDFYNISQANPIQSAVNLNNANYKLQNALITEWYSYTTADISNAAYAAADGSEALVSIDALLKISSKYAQEVRQRTNGQMDVDVISQQGLQQLWLGTFDIKVLQNA